MSPKLLPITYATAAMKDYPLLPYNHYELAVESDNVLGQMFYINQSYNVQCRHAG